MTFRKTVLRWDYRRNAWRQWYSRADAAPRASHAWVIKCGCGAEYMAAWHSQACPDCNRKRFAALSTQSAVAHRAVADAIRAGLLPPLLGQIFCIDCSRPAQCYDHRDYDRPLEVEAVCLSCNSKRGPAKQHEALVVRFPRGFKKSPPATPSAARRAAP